MEKLSKGIDTKEETLRSRLKSGIAVTRPHRDHGSGNEHNQKADDDRERADQSQFLADLGKNEISIASSTSKQINRMLADKITNYRRYQTNNCNNKSIRENTFG